MTTRHERGFQRLLDALPCRGASRPERSLVACYRGCCRDVGAAAPGWVLGRVSNAADGHCLAVVPGWGRRASGDRSESLGRARQAVRALSSASLRELRAVLVDVCGVPVHEEYRSTTAEQTHTVASVTKSFVGTLVGIALADGSLKSLDQTLSELLPEHRQVMSPAVASITLRQLLTMTAGLDADQADGSTGPWRGSDHFVEGILREGVVGTPGTFAYSSASSHLLSAIVAKATGRSMLDYATEKLFDPLGIDTTRAPSSRSWRRASVPAYEKAALRVAGRPPRHQLRCCLPQAPAPGPGQAGAALPRARQLAGKADRAADLGPGRHQRAGPHVRRREHYGYQWWVTTAGGHPAYAAIGFGGQLIEVVPDKALVVVFATHFDILSAIPPGPSPADYHTMVSGAIVPALP